MSIILNDNLDTQFNKPLDTRFGPYTDVATALTQVPAFRRYIGLTIGIGSNPVVEYWFNDGILDVDFVIKTVDSVVDWGEIEGTLSNQTDLQNALNSKQDSLGFTPENVSNKSTTLDADKLSNTKYPSVKSVYDWAVGLFATITQLGTKQDTLVSGTNIKTINSNTLLGSGDVVIDKTSVGLGNVANVDTTNASNITSGTLGDARLSSNVTTQGNTFNAANKLVQLDATAKLPAVDGSQLTNLPSFSPPNGLLKIASAISTTFQNVTDYLANASVLFLNSRRVGIGKDTSVTTQSVAVVEVQDANTSIVLKPNGTGGIIASVPDGTATGGNARGTNAVDLQTFRSVNTQVASAGSSVISGGRDNLNSSVYGFIGAGYNNRIGIFSGGNNDIAVICGGQNNQTQGPSNWQFIGGGASNFNSSGYGVVSGGQSNTASTNTHATVVGGFSNVASGQYSVAGGNGNTASGFRSGALSGAGLVSSGQHSVIAGGNDSIINGNYSFLGSGQLNTIGNGTHNATSGGRSNVINNGVDYSFLGGGQSNTISGASGGADWGVICGGQSNTIENSYTSILGGNNNYAFGLFSSVLGTKDGYSYLYGSTVSSGGLFSTRGDAQQSLLTARNSSTLTTGATLVLSLDGTGTTNLIIPSGNNRAWNVQVDTIAVVTAITGTATGVSVGHCYRETKQLLFKRIGGTSSIVGTVDTSAIKSDSGMSTASITISAGGSQQMAITFTAPTFAGGGSVTCRVVSKVMLVEVAY